MAQREWDLGRALPPRWSIDAGIDLPQVLTLKRLRAALQEDGVSGARGAVSQQEAKGALAALRDAATDACLAQVNELEAAGASDAYLEGRARALVVEASILQNRSWYKLAAERVSPQLASLHGAGTLCSASTACFSSCIGRSSPGRRNAGSLRQRWRRTLLVGSDCLHAASAVRGAILWSAVLWSGAYGGAVFGVFGAVGGGLDRPSGHACSRMVGAVF